MKTHLTLILGVFMISASARAAESPEAPKPVVVKLTDEKAADDKVSDNCPDCNRATACKVCVPEHTTKKKETTTYSTKCVDFCVPKSTWLLHALRGGSCCSDPNCGACQSHCGTCGECRSSNCVHCGHVRTKKVLIKKVQTTDVDKIECVPRTVSH